MSRPQVVIAFPTPHPFGERGTLDAETPALELPEGLGQVGGRIGLNLQRVARHRATIRPERIPSAKLRA